MKHLNFSKLKVGVTVLEEDAIVYKKLSSAVCQLWLPKGTKVMKSSPIYNIQCKLRVNQAIVLAIVPYFSTTGLRSDQEYQEISPDETRFFNLKMGKAKRLCYEVGNVIKPDGFNTDRFESCGQGIHVFTTEKRAKEY